MLPTPFHLYGHWFCIRAPIFTSISVSYFFILNSLIRFSFSFLFISFFSLTSSRDININVDLLQISTMYLKRPFRLVHLPCAIGYTSKLWITRS